MNCVATRCLVCGLLGLATTVIVCWTLALQTDWRTGPRRNFRTGLSMLEFSSPGQNTTWTFFPIAQRGVLQLSAGNSGPDNTGNSQPLPAERMAEEHDVPAWSVMRRGDDRGIFGAVYLEQGFGFPGLAMAQQFRWANQSMVPEVDGLPVPGALQRIGPGEWVPTRFVWTGLAVDAILYGWLWYAALEFPGILLRAVRHWRHVCPGCGYDVRHVSHDRCPECGRRCTNAERTN